MRPLPQKTIGILGGMSDQATMAFYHKINQFTREKLGGWDIAEVIIQGVNFGNIEYFVRNDLWDEASDYLVNKAKLAEAGGADVLICVSNTMHKVMDDVQKAISIPFLHIADATSAAIQSKGIQKVGILGTKPIMADTYMSEYYKDKFNIEVLSPTKEDQTIIDQIIFDELVKGVFTPASKQEYVRISREMQSRGVQGIILGCTEIFMLLKPEDLPDLPLFDTAELHARAVVAYVN